MGTGIKISFLEIKFYRKKNIDSKPMIKTLKGFIYYNDGFQPIETETNQKPNSERVPQSYETNDSQYPIILTHCYNNDTQLGTGITNTFFGN